MSTEDESVLEEKLIKHLKIKGYESVSIRDENDLKINLREQIERFNSKKLRDIPLSDNEFRRIYNHLNQGTIFDRAEKLRDQFVLIRDDESSVRIDFLNTKDYCKNIFQVSNQITMIRKYSQGLTSDTWNLKYPLISQIKINVPDLKEQIKISNFLSLIDEKIVFMQKKHKNITRMKNQILSENISDIVRNNPKRKLKELFDFKKGNGLSKEKISSEGKYPVILYGELYTTYNEIIENVVSFSEYDEGVCSKKGDILIPASTTTKGIDLVTASVVQEDNVQLGGDINIFRKKTNLNSIYVATFLKYDMKREILRLTQGSTIIHLYGKDLEDLEINLPNLEIQDNIANLLNFLIKKENLIQNEINELNKFKKGLLQKMFV